MERVEENSSVTKRKPRTWMYVDGAGYWQFTCGKFRGRRVHRVVAEQMLGRPLSRTEDIHHKDGNKWNNHPTNLEVIDHTAHGYVSARQAWWLKHKDQLELQMWTNYFEEPIDADSTEERTEVHQLESQPLA